MKLSIDDLKTFSFAIYGLGKTGKSIVNFFKKNKIKNYFVWDDHKKIPNSKNIITTSLDKSIKIYSFETGELKGKINKQTVHWAI